MDATSRSLMNQACQHSRECWQVLAFDARQREDNVVVLDIHDHGLRNDVEEVLSHAHFYTAQHFLWDQTIVS